MTYTYNDICITPESISTISSRSECNPYVEGNTLPIFTAPMSTIVDENNYKVFKENGIIPIIPRSVDAEIRKQLMLTGEWVAVSLKEFEEWFIKIGYLFGIQLNICIDIANGHMQSLLDAIKYAKTKHDHLTVMTGNIANPNTLENYNKIVDFARLGIGAGNGCITSSNTGIHYPMASLVHRARNIQYIFEINTQIIADGGIRNYSDVIKALALGANYVMIGSLFAKCEEACGDTIEINGERYHHFYGMASKEGQIDLQGAKCKTAEGISKNIKIEYTLKQWVQNMTDYLKSAMSYCNTRNLKEFIGNQCYEIMSPNAQLAINK